MSKARRGVGRISLAERDFLPPTHPPLPPLHIHERPLRRQSEADAGTEAGRTKEPCGQRR